MLKACATTRVPGRMARICGRSFMLIDGRRYMVSTVAWVKSLTKMSPWTICALPRTPAACALRWACATMSGLYSIPSERSEERRVGKEWGGGVGGWQEGGTVVVGEGSVWFG